MAKIENIRDIHKLPATLQDIVSNRRVIREELANNIIEILNSIPAGYGMSVENYKAQAIARIEALIPEGESDD